MIPPQPVARIAPTPSGYLHIGNAVNFILTWLAVRLHDGHLMLRIDDLDKERCKPRYVDDVFYALEWLGIEPDAGPSGTSEFYASYSQTLRYDTYRNALATMRENGAHLFACTCSRRQLAGSQRYPGTCRESGHELLAMQSALRIEVPPNTAVSVGGEPVQLDETVGDFILWRRDDIPAYQLVSVVEDVHDGINLIIRGRDLFESSAAQLFLAPFLDAGTFSDAAFLHHDLILRPDGSKFSKSDRDVSLRSMRESMGDRHALQSVFDALQRMLGLNPVKIEHPITLLQRCLDLPVETIRSNTLLHALAAPFPSPRRSM